jgi:hypothetical protein
LGGGRPSHGLLGNLAPRNVAFYRRTGGELVGEGVAAGADRQYWLFRWEPNNPERNDN